jgi:ankyrin repeat protein
VPTHTDSDAQSRADGPDEMSRQAASFLQSLEEPRLDRACEILSEYPGVATHSIHTAAAIANAQAVAGLLASDPAQATARFGAQGPEPIIFAADGRLPSLLGIPASDRVRTVALLLDAGADANAFVTIDDDPQARIPALYFACVSNNVDVARLLLDRGANPNDGESVYHAAEHDHRDCLDLLLEHGADISNDHEHWGNTPLYFLAGYTESHPNFASSVRGMRWLLEHGANPNARSYVGMGKDGTAGVAETPLHRIAALSRSVDVAQMLVTHGADVDSPRGDGKTAYALAIRSGNTPVAEFLSQRGARSDVLSAEDRLLAACLGGDDATAQQLCVDFPGIMDSLNADERQVLMTAVERDNVAAVRVLLKQGWSLSAEGSWGGTPLHWAAWFGRVRMVQLLLSHAAPINLRDNQHGSTPIGWACHGSINARPGHDDDYIVIAGMLLDAGASRAESINRWGELPENMASAAVASALRDRGFTA